MFKSASACSLTSRTAPASAGCQLATLTLGDGVHCKIAITLDTYSHALPTIQREDADRVASLIFGASQ